MTIHGNTFWEIIKPLATTNVIINPSVETDTTGWTSDGSTVTRVSDEQMFGAFSLKAVTSTGTTDGLYYTAALASGSTYAFSVFFKATTGNSYKITISTTGGSVLDSTSFTSTGRWQRVEVIRAESSSNDRRLTIEKDSDSAVRTFYVDAAQLEIQSVASTYCDGDQAGCSWLGEPHASLSTREVQTREGGEIINLNSDYDVIVRQQLGTGMPITNNVFIEMALLDGGIFQRSRAGTRTLVLEGVISGSDVNDFHFNRQRLIDVVKPDVVSPEQTFLLRYTGVDNVTKQIRCYYDAGLEGTAARANIESFSLRLLALNPFFEEIGDEAVELGGTEISGVNYILQRNSSGSWAKLGTGLDAAVRSVIQANDATWYAGGVFESAGGVTASYVAQWTGAAWTDLDGGVQGDWLGVGNVAVDALALAPNGNIFLGGAFETAGSVSACSIVEWDGNDFHSLTEQGSSEDGIKLNPTFKRPISDLVFDDNGLLWVSGSFGTAGSITACNIAIWDTNTCRWATPGSAGADDHILAMSLGLDGDIYIAGNFTNVGGSSVVGVARYFQSSSKFSASQQIGDGLLDDGDALAVATNGDIWVGGQNIIVDPTDATNISQDIGFFNGQAWTAAGSTSGGIGAQGGIDTLFYEKSKNVLYAGMTGCDVNAKRLPNRLAKYNGSLFLPFDVRFAAANITFGGNGIFEGRDEVLTIGFSVATTASIGFQNITNNGTAATLPAISIAGSGRVYNLINYTNDTEIGFDNYVLSKGEILTIDLPNNSFVSTTKGNIINRITPSSDLATWKLQPGENGISLTMDDYSASVILQWKKRHWAMDGGAQ